MLHDVHEIWGVLLHHQDMKHVMDGCKGVAAVVYMPQALSS